jgi:hypothetical protein
MLKLTGKTKTEKVDRLPVIARVELLADVLEDYIPMDVEFDLEKFINETMKDEDPTKTMISALADGVLYGNWPWTR